MKSNEIKKMVLAALMVALAVVLARVVHALMGWQGGGILLPMHIPVLLCGFFCGWKYGLLCGILSPLVNLLISGGPTGPTLISMEFELATYGLCAGLLSSPRLAFLGRPFGRYAEIAHTVIALVLSMLIGRAVWGIVKAVISVGNPGSFGFQTFLAGAFVTAIIGIIIQLILIPVLVTLFRRSKLGRELR